MGSLTEGSESTAVEMMRYVRLDGTDLERLRAFGALAHPLFPRVADVFYDRIREHEDAHAVFVDEAQVDRLKRSLVGWLDGLCSGPHDAAYFESVARIGHTHVRVGLPPRYMPVAMSVVRHALLEIADNVMGPEVQATKEAICKALDVELVVMLEAYGEAAKQRAKAAGAAEIRSLTQTERGYRTAVEVVRTIMIGLDRRGFVRLFNHEAERVTGFGREEAYGRPFVETFIPEPLREEQGPIFAAALQGTVSKETTDGSLRDRTGKIRDVVWQLAWVPADADDDLTLFVTGKDVTDEIILAARVRQSEKLAAVGTLAAGLAHEIRNPLNGAQLHLTFLERGLSKLPKRDEEMEEAIRVVRLEIQRLATLVSEFLDFARPRPLDRRPISLTSLCEHTLMVIGADARDSLVRTHSDMPTTDIEVDGDPDKLVQVLLNLLRNAIEALAPTGGGNVILRLRRQPRVAVIEVEDEGPGVSNPEAPIFDPFFSTKPSGTGLGLAIAHRIVTDHGGSIELTSRPGKTIFRVTLPIPLRRT